MSPLTDDAVLRLDRVTKVYGQATVLQELSLDVRRGEFLTILGPSGSGKTTVLQIIAGIVQHTSGRLLFDDEDMGTLPASKRPFNTVFQDYALFPHMTVADNVGYGPRVKGIKREDLAPLVEQALDHVELGGMGKRYPSQLSGGQRQRVALARALINKPSIVLLDEPLSALDAVLRRQMQLFLKAAQKSSGVTFVFVTHDQEEAVAMSDRICVMNAGSVVQLGTPAQIYHEPANRFVSNFMGETNALAANVLSVEHDRVVLQSQLGRLVASNRHYYSFGVGDDVLLTVRPESVHLGPFKGNENTNVITASVLDHTFLGPSSKLTVGFPQAGNVRWEMRTLGSHAYANKTPEVSESKIWFHADDCALVPASSQ